MRHVLPQLEIGETMHNRDLAKWFNAGEITMKEYLRIAKERDDVTLHALSIYDAPQKAYMGDVYDKTDGYQRFYEHQQDDIAEED